MKNQMSDEIKALLSKFELQVQQVRIEYLKWVKELDFSEFGPNEQPYLCECFKEREFGRKIDTFHGNLFTFSPFGFRSLYIGNKKGSLSLKKIDDKCFGKRDEGLRKEINATVKALKGKISNLSSEEEKYEAIANYWWIKLGLHEYLYHEAKDYPQETSGSDFKSKLLHNLRVKSKEVVENIPKNLTITNWNRYGCCSFDCGPILWQKGEFKSCFEFFDGLKQDENSKVRIDSAIEKIKQYYNVELDYRIGFKEVDKKITQVEANLLKEMRSHAK